MVVYVVRHGQSQSNLEGRHSGTLTVSLTEQGFEDAKLSGEKLKDIKFNYIYSSDFTRAIQTAQTAIKNCNPTIDPLLREIELGSVSNKIMQECWDTLGEDYANARKKRDFSVFGGESSEMQMERVSKFMKKLETLEPDSNIAVFCHEGTVKCFLANVLKMDKFPLNCKVIKNGGIAIFEFKNNKWYLSSWNV